MRIKDLGRWWCTLTVFVAVGCSHVHSHGSSAFDCGIPVLDDEPVGGRIEIGPQLPPGITIEDGCWEQLPNGRLEGIYAVEDVGNGYNTEIFVFSYSGAKWTLVEMRHELQIWHSHK